LKKNKRKKTLIKAFGLIGAFLGVFIVSFLFLFLKFLKYFPKKVSGIMLYLIGGGSFVIAFISLICVLVREREKKVDKRKRQKRVFSKAKNS